MTRLTLAGIFVALIVGGSLTPNAGGISGQELSDTVNVPQGDATLGTVSIPRRVLANGDALPAGDYEVHLTAQSAAPDAVGALNVLERWVEFRQGSDVRGREVVSIVPNEEIGDVAKSAGPGSGASRVEVLKENEYLRVWINQSGTHYLIHLVVG